MYSKAILATIGIFSIAPAIADDPPAGAQMRCAAVVTRYCDSGTDCRYLMSETEYWLYPNGRILTVMNGKARATGTRRLQSFDDANPVVNVSRFSVEYAGDIAKRELRILAYRDPARNTPSRFILSDGKAEDIGLCHARS